MECSPGWAERPPRNLRPPAPRSGVWHDPCPPPSDSDEDQRFPRAAGGRSPARGVTEADVRFMRGFCSGSVGDQGSNGHRRADSDTLPGKTSLERCGETPGEQCGYRRQSHVAKGRQRVGRNAGRASECILPETSPKPCGQPNALRSRDCRIRARTSVERRTMPGGDGTASFPPEGRPGRSPRREGDVAKTPGERCG